jgi:hypothetical protein
LEADAAQPSLCAYLSIIALAGVVLNAALSWWWADPVAALGMVPIIAKEGVEGVQGEAGCDCHPWEAYFPIICSCIPMRRFTRSA